MDRKPSEVAAGCFGGGVVLILFVLIVLYLAGFHQVSAGEVGVIKTGGAVTGTEDAGYTHCSWPFCSIDYVSIKVANKPFDEIDGPTCENQSVKVTGQINYHIDKSKVSSLYAQLDLSDIETTLLSRPLQDYVKEATVKYPASDGICPGQTTAQSAITQHRPDIRQHALDALNANLSAHYPGIIIDDIYLNNLGFSDAYNKAIEEKQVAQQQVAKAQQDQARAAVDAATAKIKADGEANANKALNESLTPSILQQHAIDKWNGILPQVSGSGGTPFISLPAAPTPSPKP